MYNGIGLQTPRGSGTNGYIQTNKFFVRPKLNKITENTRGFEPGEGTAGLSKKANKDILEHDRKRQIELKLVVLEDKLSEQGFTDDEIAEKISETRKVLEAAAASDEIVIFSEKKSNTQTHQVAARKEKQMETLRAALGIADPNKQVDEGDGDGDVHVGDRMIDDGKPREHSFLDRDSSWKKRVDDDSKSGKDDKKKSAKVVKSRKDKGDADELDNGRKQKKEEKSRKYDDDTDSSASSDEDDSRKIARGSRKKSRKDRKKDSESDSDVDIGKKKKKIKSSKKQSRSRRHDSDSSSGTDASDSAGTDSESDSDADIAKKKKKTKSFKRPGKSRRSDTDDSDLSSGSDASDSDSDGVKLRSRKNADQHKSSHKRHDSDDDHGTMKVASKIEADKNKRVSRRHDSDDSHSDDERRPALQTQKEKYQESLRRRQQDSEDDSDANGRSKNKRSEVRRYKDENVGIRRGERDDVHGGSDRETDKKKKTLSRMSKRHDSDDEDSDSPHVQKSSRGAARTQKAAKRQSTSPSDGSLSDTDSDDSHNGRKHQRSARITTIDDRWDMVQKPVGNTQVIRGKRKQNDDYVAEQPELKSRIRDIRKDVGLEKDKQETKFESESSRARRDMDDRRRDYLSRDDRRRDGLSRSIKSQVERDGDKGGQEGRTRNKNYETQTGKHGSDEEEEQEEIRKDRDYEDRRGSRRKGSDEEEEDGEIRNDKDYEDRRGGSRRHGRDEEEHRGRKHSRDDEVVNHDEERPYDSRRDRRGEEEERRSRGSNQRDRKSDSSSKRARY